MLNGMVENLPSSTCNDSSEFNDFGQHFLKQAMHITERQIQITKMITSAIIVLF